MKSIREKKKKKLNKKGYKFSTEQHNGTLYAKIVRGTLFRAVIQRTGTIRYYRPKKANKYQRRIFS